MLSDQKCSSDKTGQGFDKFAASSSHVASTSRTMFVNLGISNNKSHVDCVDKGKSVSVHDHMKVEPKIPVKKQSKFIHTCHHCGIIGHTQPYSFQICSKKPRLNSMFL
jgi:hypothetical protein